jgi:hypothetical protein
MLLVKSEASCKLDSVLLQYADLLSRGNFTREDIVTVLTANHGNIEAAYLELSKTQLKPFLMRIWGPPNGTENESGNISTGDTEVITNETPDAVVQKHHDEEGNHQLIMIQVASKLCQG